MKRPPQSLLGQHSLDCGTGMGSSIPCTAGPSPSPAHALLLARFARFGSFICFLRLKHHDPLWDPSFPALLRKRVVSHKSRSICRYVTISSLNLRSSRHCICILSRQRLSRFGDERKGTMAQWVWCYHSTDAGTCTELCLTTVSRVCRSLS